MLVSSISNRQLTNSMLNMAKNPYYATYYFNVNKTLHEIFDDENFMIVKTKTANRGNFKIGKL